MKRMVVDKNMLEDPKNLGEKHPLRAWLAASKDQIVVITDYAQLEMLKGNALKNILKSTEILAEFPSRFIFSSPSGPSPPSKARKRR